MPLTYRPLVTALKKLHWHLYRGTGCSGWAHAQDRQEPLVCRLQETHVSMVGLGPHRTCLVGTAGQLDGSRQCGRRWTAGAGAQMVRAAIELATRLRRCGHGLLGGGEQA